MIKLKNKKQVAEKNNKQVMKETLLTEESPELSLAEKLREKKRLQKKKNRKRISWYTFGVLFALFLYWGFMPFEGTVPYALCKIIIELNVPYPPTLKFTEVAELRTGDIKIWFTHVDPFGGFRQEPFLCSFGTDPETQKTVLTRAKWGNVDLDAKQIEHFNKIMPYLVASGYYDTTYPAPLPESIDQMKLQTDRFRKVNIMDLITKKQ